MNERKNEKIFQLNHAMMISFTLSFPDSFRKNKTKSEIIISVPHQNAHEGAEYLQHFASN